MHINLPKLRKFLFLSLIIFTTFLIGFGLGSIGDRKLNQVNLKAVVNRAPPEDKNLDFSLFWQIWDIVEDNYIDKNKIVPTNLIYGATKGMVAAIGDPYTVFLTPDENKVTAEDLEGNFEGVGIQIGFIGTQLAVVSPLPGSPAEKAGIMPGDYIIGITDEAKKIDHSTSGMDLTQAVQEIRGPSGSMVTLTLMRKDVVEPLQIAVIRQSIDVPSVTLSLVGKDQTIAHLKIIKFGGETKAEWDENVVEVLKNPNIRGLIVDVRNNPGGYLQGAVDIGTEFLNLNDTVVSEQRTNGQKQDYKTDRVGRFKNYSTVVLINKGSASASEILAAALNEHLKTPLVGTVTFGKGTIQERKELPEGVALHITAAKWLTPNGKWLNEVGLEPSVKIEDDPETAEDEQLTKAIDLIESQSALVKK